MMGGATRDIALSYGAGIKYFEKDNGGVASALNYGIKMMKGDYFSWLSHDDVYYPKKIEKQIFFLKDNPADTILYGDYEYINESSEIIGIVRNNPVKPEKFRYSLLFSHPIHGCTSLIPRACFINDGVFNNNLKTTQDYDYWFRLSNKYKFIHMSEILIKSRIHMEQGSRNILEHNYEINEFYINSIKEYNKRELLLDSGEDELSKVYLKLAEIYRRRNLYSAYMFVINICFENKYNIPLLEHIRKILFMSQVNYKNIINKMKQRKK